MKYKLVVMIPAFNEEKTIASVIREIPKQIGGISSIKVLVIDDGSSDETSRVSKQAGADVVIRNTQNLGLGRNFKKGIDCALKLGADIIVNIDGDGQFNPKDIPNLINPILKGEADMVTVSRFLNPKLTKDMPFVRKWGNKRFTKLVNRITGQKFTDTQCGFRAYSKEAAIRLNLNGKFTYTQETFLDLASKGMRIVEIPSEVRYFEKRDSKVSGSLMKYGLKSLGIITRATRDTQPLTFFGMPALIIFSLGVLGGLFSFVYYLIEHITTPIKTLLNVSIFLMIFGFSLAILALLADMLLTIKKNQEEILYRLKIAEYSKALAEESKAPVKVSRYLAARMKK